MSTLYCVCCIILALLKEAVPIVALILFVLGFIFLNTDSYHGRPVEGFRARGAAPTPNPNGAPVGKCTV
jgi:hypothetical protein